MDIIKLRYFRAVAQTENISQAAEKLHISQPALSKAISLLEEEMGTPLFDRVGRRIGLNEYGYTFLQYAETALEALDNGIDAVQKLANPSTTVIRLQTNISSNHYLVELMRGFRQIHQEVVFDVIKNYAKSKFLYDCDLYIHASQIILNKCTSVPLFTEEILLGVPVSHPLAAYEHIPLRMAANEMFVTLSKTTSWTEEISNFCIQAGFKPRFSYTCDGNEILEKLISAGEGVGFLPAESWGEFQQGVKLLHLDEPTCTRSYYLSWQIDKAEMPIVKEFKEYVLTYF